MKFKGTFNERGIRILEKGFLPTLEKFGKNCQLLLGESDVHLVQSVLNTDGIKVTIRFGVDVIFDPNSYRCQSRHFNLIAVTVDVELLLRVLRGAGANHAESLEVKLGLVQSTNADGSEGPRVPFLIFTGRGPSLSMTQEVPISKPYTPSDIDRLVQAKDVAELCPYYLDLLPVAPQLLLLGERMKGLNTTATLATTKGGDVHLLAPAATVVLGTHTTGLPVFPSNVQASTEINRDLPAEEQLQAALDAGDATAVRVHLKHLNRVLKATQLTQPSQLLCGIAEGSGHVHVMFVYRNPDSDAAYDDSTSISFQLPVRDEA